MYKLFLTLRYLTRKKIVIFPILVVWLCVMMLIIVSSIMQGFVDRVRDANRDLYGDIIVSSASSSQGFAGYDDLAKQIRANFQDVRAITPVVEAFSLIYSPAQKRSLPSLLVGIRPDERSQVTSFRQSLTRQYQSPLESVNLLAPRLPATRDELVDHALKHYKSTMQSNQDAFDAIQKLYIQIDTGHPPGPEYGRFWMLALVAAISAVIVLRARQQHRGRGYLTASCVGLVGSGLIALGVFWPVLFPRQIAVAEDNFHQARMDLDQAKRTVDLASSLPAGVTFQNRGELVKALVPANPSFGLPPAARNDPGLASPPPEGCVVGSQMLYRRDTRGNFEHSYPDVYPKISITVFPPSNSGRISVTGTNAVTQDFTIVDGSHTGVYDVDSLNVYAPFETVQLMAGMRPDPRLVAADPTADFAPRAHQLLIRLSPAGETRMKELRFQINEFVQKYLDAHKQTDFLEVQTWDEKQAKYLGTVQNEKTMLTFILLLMSGVVLVVIFLIFYQIVRDKTRDIGIIKAVGGSEVGVAAIFLSYGLMIGIVGGGLGALSGALFVTHTNQIHELIFQTTGFIIWDRSVYLFDRIPDVVHTSDILLYFTVALVAGVLGALIPAILAALEDPVQAVRYE